MLHDPPSAAAPAPASVPAAPKSSDRQRPPFRVPITWILQISITTLLAAAVASVLAISLVEGSRAARVLLQERAGRTIGAVVTRLLTGYVDPLVRGVDGIAAAIEAGTLDPADAEAMHRFIGGAMAATPQLGDLAFIRPDRRADVFTTDGRLLRDQDYDLPEIRDAFAHAGSAGLQWTPPLWSPMLAQPILSAIRPVRRNGRLLGILRPAVALGDLSRFLTELTPDDAETAFIVYGDRFLVARARPQPPTVAPSAAHPLPGLDEIGDPVLSRLWTSDAQPIALLDATLTARTLATPDGEYTVVYQTREAGTDKAWIIGTYSRGNLAAAELRRLARMGMAGVAILVLAVALVLVVGRRLSQPIVALAGAAAAIDRQDLAGYRPLAPSRVREVDQAAGAFNRMVEGLKERERIRDLFGRYVPRDVAKSLLADPHALALGGSKREISMLFSDIADFTTMSEQLAPDQVLSLLNRYFEQIYILVNDQGGIIVDFIGDGMFAIFGMPVAHPDHAARAVAAACAIDRFADGFARECRSQDVPMGQTRIGLHTGIATVGNMGSLHRVKYSAVGDVVNTASRLEGANKLFGTRILASAETVRQAGIRDCRPLGALGLKGRTAALAVFELATGAPPDSWAAYRAAYARLEAGDAAALDAFRALATAAPDDGVVRAHLDRLEAGLASPVIELHQK